MQKARQPVAYTLSTLCLIAHFSSRVPFLSQVAWPSAFCIDCLVFSHLETTLRPPTLRILGVSAFSSELFSECPRSAFL